MIFNKQTNNQGYSFYNTCVMLPASPPCLPTKSGSFRKVRAGGLIGATNALIT